MTRSILPALAIAAATTAAPALACSPIMIEKPDQIRAAARAAYRDASAIIDGVVIGRNARGEALVRVTRVWKGDPKLRTIRLVTQTSCDIGFSRKGETMSRLLLSGRDPYTAGQLENGGATGDGALYAREIELMIGRGNSRLPPGPPQRHD